jgi:hypothetical protein
VIPALLAGELPPPIRQPYCLAKPQPTGRPRTLTDIDGHLDRPPTATSHGQPHPAEPPFGAIAQR